MQRFAMLPIWKWNKNRQDFLLSIEDAQGAKKKDGELLTNLKMNKNRKKSDFGGIKIEISRKKADVLGIVCDSFYISF